MLHAARAGDLKQVAKLLDAGLPISAMIAADDYKGEPPEYQAINIAADREHVALVRLLLDRGANANARTSYGATPLQETGNLETARLLYSRGAKVVVDGDEGGGCINTAALEGDIPMIRFYLSHGAKINALQKSNGMRPVLTAAWRCDSDRLVETLAFLLEHGADPRSQVSRGDFDIHVGMEPLHLLAEASTDNLPEWLKAAELLIRHGASVTAVDSYGQQPLHIAECSGMVRFLLANGAPVNTYDKKLRQPIHRFATMFEDGKIAALLDHGADRDAVDGEGKTALDVAAQYGNDGVIKFLLSQGARPTQKTIKIAVESEGSDSSTARLLRSATFKVGRLAAR